MLSTGVLNKNLNKLFSYPGQAYFLPIHFCPQYTISIIFFQILRLINRMSNFARLINSMSNFAIPNELSVETGYVLLHGALIWLNQTRTPTGRPLVFTLRWTRSIYRTPWKGFQQLILHLNIVIIILHFISLKYEFQFQWPTSRSG